MLPWHLLLMEWKQSEQVSAVFKSNHNITLSVTDWKANHFQRFLQETTEVRTMSTHRSHSDELIWENTNAQVSAGVMQLLLAHTLCKTKVTCSLRIAHEYSFCTKCRSLDFHHQKIWNFNPLLSIVLFNCTNEYMSLNIRDLKKTYSCYRKMIPSPFELQSSIKLLYSNTQRPVTGNTDNTFSVASLHQDSVWQDLKLH